MIRAADGRVVYDADVNTEATAGDCPDTANPSLWRQRQLTSIQGLVVGTFRPGEGRALRFHLPASKGAVTGSSRTSRRPMPDVLDPGLQRLWVSG